MADPGYIDLKLLSGSTDGMPIVVTATSAGTPQDIHASPSGTSTIDLVYLWVTNTHASTTYQLGVLVYATSPADPTHLACKVDVPPGGGIVIALDGYPVTNSKKVAVWCATTSVLAVSGKVGRATL